MLGRASEYEAIEHRLVKEGEAGREGKGGLRMVEIRPDVEGMDRASEVQEEAAPGGAGTSRE